MRVKAEPVHRKQSIEEFAENEAHDAGFRYQVPDAGFGRADRASEFLRE